MPDRRWIAYELHDGLLQWVLGARMQVAALNHSLRNESSQQPLDREALYERLSQVQSFLNEAAEEGRQLIQFVEEQADRRVNAAVAIQAHCLMMSMHPSAAADADSSRVRFEPPEPAWPELAPRKAWSIVRIVQQALTNAVQHSGAESIRVRLSRPSDGEVMVEVIDDGCGFELGIERPGHVGLRSMQQRARQAKLQLAIDSAPGRGCKVSLKAAVE